MEVCARVFTNQAQYTQHAYPKGLHTKEFLSGESDAGMFFTPNFKGEFSPGEISGKISINSKGCRDYEREYKNQGKFRVLALGDSAAFGHGVEFEKSFLTILENSLNSLYKGSTEIIKCAVPGGNPRHYLRFLKHEGYKYNPDLVMVNFFMGNDVFTDFTKGESDIAEPEDIPMIWKLKKFLRINSMLYGVVADRLKGSPQIRKYLLKLGFVVGYSERRTLTILKKKYSDSEEILWGKAFNYLKEINKLSNDLVVVFIPHREQIDIFARKILADQAGKTLEEFDPHSSNKKLRSFLDKQKIKHIDLLKDFEEYYKASKMPLYFEIDPHWNQEGNKFFAELLTKEKIFQNYLPKK